jgi:hypothetical protein
MYLRDPAGRAIFQGDVFDDIPFTKAGAGNNVNDRPAWSANRCTAATILYPCDMVQSDNVTLNKAQPIARVYDAAAKGLSIPADWEGVLGVCPLPDLRGDGRMWVADFRSLSVVDRTYLRVDCRVRVLSEFGWAVFRQRLVGAMTRGLAQVEDMLEIGRQAWAESTMEAQWVQTGRDQAAFQEWLDDPDATIPYKSRRDALEAGAIGLVRTALDYELAGD